MSIIIIGLIIIVFGGLLAVSISNTNKTSKSVQQTSSQVMEMVELNNLKDELKEMKKLIKVKQQELDNLVHATEQAKRRTVTNLTVEQEEALDLYSSFGIRLPIDIIEELSYSNNVTFHSAVDFIEMQRKVWKTQFSVPMTKGMVK